MEEYFLNALYNEYENKFLAAVGLENVNVTDKIDTMTVEKPTEAPKFARFHGQQFGRFLLNLLIEILFFVVFQGLKQYVQALDLHKFEFCVISDKPFSSCLMFLQPFVFHFVSQ